MQQICVCYVYTAATSSIYQNSCLTFFPFPACRAVMKITVLSQRAQCYKPEDYSVVHSNSIRLFWTEKI